MSMSPQTVSGEANICPYEDYFQAAWDDYVMRHPQGSLFHLTSWKRVIERAFGYRAQYLFMEQEGAIRGVLPMFQVSSPIQGRTLISTPFAVYGGPCADNEQIARELRKA